MQPVGVRVTIREGDELLLTCDNACVAMISSFNASKDTLTEYVRALCISRARHIRSCTCTLRINPTGSPIDLYRNKKV